MPASGTNRVALVTGATQGIGRAIAMRLAADGMRVAVNGREHTDAMREAVGQTSGIAAPADISDPHQITSMVEMLETEYRSPDVLVSNAAYMSMGSIDTYDVTDWWRVVDTNLRGTFQLVQAVLPAMRERRRGRIVIVASEWGVIGWPNATAYAASKAGLIALTKSLGRELAPDGIIVNCVAPGVIDTPQLEVDSADAGVDLSTIRERYADETPLGRIGSADEVASAVAMLTNDKIESLVGQTIQINGGTTRCRA